MLLGQGSTFYNIEHENYWDLIYYGPVIVGSEQQEVKAVWDTGSHYWLTTSDLCSSCNDAGRLFDTGESTSWVISDPLAEGDTLYGDGTYLNGYWGADSVCLSTDTDTCVSNFPFLAIYDQSGFD